MLIKINYRYLFSDICHRQRARWDIKMPNSPAWIEFCTTAVELATPVLQEFSSSKRLRFITSGVVVSHPGAEEQVFHADGEAGLFNVFVPLVDIDASSDGTQFWPGSQVRPAPSAEDALALSQDSRSIAQMVAPACDAGGLLLFDYRVTHRGLPNGRSVKFTQGKKKKKKPGFVSKASKGRERAIAYIVVATDETASDSNFPPNSVFDADPDVKQKECAPSARMYQLITGESAPSE